MDDKEGSGGVVAVYEATSLKRKAEEEEEEVEEEDETELDRWSLGFGDYEGSEQQQLDFVKYVEECAASDCFDVEFIPKSKNFLGMLVRVNVDDDRDFFSQHCKETIQIVLHQRGTDLELVKLIKANREGSAFYYATFEGRNRASGDLNTYQMSVFRCMIEGDDIEVENFRLKQTGDTQVVQT